MRFAVDTSVFVSFFLRDKLYEKAVEVFDHIIKQEIYACVSTINIAEIGYVIERATKDEEYAYNTMYVIFNETPIDVLNLTWDFITTLAHFKAINTIPFCDNATITAANLTKSKALFTKEKEIITKTNIVGAEIMFLEEL